MTRAEAVLTSVIGQPTILFPSGIAATFACLVHTRPNVIAITKGYHGCHESIQVYRRLLGEDNVRVILLDDDYTLKASEKLLCWLETPLNPTGECRDIAYYAKKTHDVGGILAIDSTFGPPPLQVSTPFVAHQNRSAEQSELPGSLQMGCRYGDALGYEILCWSFRCPRRNTVRSHR